MSSRAIRCSRRLDCGDAGDAGVAGCGDDKLEVIEVVGAVAERFDIHPQTLRLYEREGLINPVRSAGNTRLYDEATLERLEIILTFTRDLGVNLAGVEVILNMRSQLEELQAEVDAMRERVQRETDRRRYALVRVSSRALSKR